MNNFATALNSISHHARQHYVLERTAKRKSIRTRRENRISFRLCTAQRPDCRESVKASAVREIRSLIMGDVFQLRLMWTRKQSEIKTRVVRLCEMVERRTSNSTTSLEIWSISKIVSRLVCIEEPTIRIVYAILAERLKRASQMVSGLSQKQYSTDVQYRKDSIKARLHWKTHYKNTWLPFLAERLKRASQMVSGLSQKQYGTDVQYLKDSIKARLHWKTHYKNTRYHFWLKARRQHLKYRTIRPPGILAAVFSIWCTVMNALAYKDVRLLIQSL